MRGFLCSYSYFLTLPSAASLHLSTIMFISNKRQLGLKLVFVLLAVAVAAVCWFHLRVAHYFKYIAEKVNLFNFHMQIKFYFYLKNFYSVSRNAVFNFVQNKQLWDKMSFKTLSNLQI